MMERSFANGGFSIGTFGFWIVFVGYNTHSQSMCKLRRSSNLVVGTWDVELAESMAQTW